MIFARKWVIKRSLGDSRIQRFIAFLESKSFYLWPRVARRCRRKESRRCPTWWESLVANHSSCVTVATQSSSFCQFGLYGLLRASLQKQQQLGLYCFLISYFQPRADHSEHFVWETQQHYYFSEGREGSLVWEIFPKAAAKAAAGGALSSCGKWCQLTQSTNS